MATLIDERLQKLIDYLEYKEDCVICPSEFFNADESEVPWCCEEFCINQFGNECLEHWLKGDK